MDSRIVLTTCPAIEVARTIAKQLVDERLAACVNIVPGIESHYWWQGKCCDERELLLIIKTTDLALNALQKRLVSLHPYDTPEFVALRPEFVAEHYRNWLFESVKV